MGNEIISLSISETNRLRSELGLRLIKPESEIAPTTKHRVKSGTQNHTKTSGNERIAFENSDSNNSPWVDSYTELSDDESSEYPLIKVAGNINLDKPTILTLKESDINNDEDILMNEDLVLERETRKNWELRKLNRARRGLKLEIGSKDILEDERAGDDNAAPDQHLYIGATSTYTQTNAHLHSEENDKRARVEFSSDEDDQDFDLMTSDFSAKRKKIQKHQPIIDKSQRGKKLEEPSTIKYVPIVDADEYSDDDAEALLKTAVKKLVEPEENDKYNGSGESQEQAKQSVTGLTLDTYSSFLESLDRQVKPQNEPPSVAAEEPGNSVFQDVTTVAQYSQSEPIEESKQEPDLYYGISGALSYLRQQDIAPHLTSKEDSRDLRTAIAQYKRDLLRNHMLTVEEVEQRVAQFREEQLALSYNPEVALQYKDNRGHTVTAKEAYKLLAQKFHGTKSNLKKQRKFKDKIELSSNARP